MLKLTYTHHFKMAPNIHTLLINPSPMTELLNFLKSSCKASTSLTVTAINKNQQLTVSCPVDQVHVMIFTIRNGNFSRASN